MDAVCISAISWLTKQQASRRCLSAALTGVSRRLVFELIKKQAWILSKAKVKGPRKVCGQPKGLYIARMNKWPVKSIVL